ncbi:hypothetical protein VULLAG_LOCUS19815 [Vulpes lagopus]
MRAPLPGNGPGPLSFRRAGAFRRLAVSVTVGRQLGRQLGLLPAAACAGPPPSALLRPEGKLVRQVSLEEKVSGYAGSHPQVPRTSGSLSCSDPRVSSV